jgi:hypothetical protein
MSEATEQTKLPKWVRELQNTSWYPEIVISLGAIYSLLTLSDSLIKLGNTLKFSAAIIGLDELFLLGMVAVKGITVGFILHIAMRGMWIALLCLNYAFPDGINFRNLKLSNWYFHQAKSFSLQLQIKSLDKLCGLIYFGSFLFILITIGFITPYLFVLPIYWLVSIFAFIENPATIFYIVGLIVMGFYVEMILNGPLRKNNTVGKFYYPLYTTLNYITLAFIYRPWIQILFSNTNRVKAFLGSSIFIAVTLIYSNIALVDLFHWKSILNQRSFPASPNGGTRTNTLYDDQLQQGEFIFVASIPTDIINTNHLRVFIPYRNSYDDGIREAQAQHFSDIVSVSLNDSLLQEISWTTIKHKTTGQTGIVARLSIAHLPYGKNELTINIHNNWGRFKTLNGIHIPFWKD